MRTCICLRPNNEIGTLIPLRGSQKHEPDVSLTRSKAK